MQMATWVMNGCTKAKYYQKRKKHKSGEVSGIRGYTFTMETGKGERGLQRGSKKSKFLSI